VKKIGFIVLALVVVLGSLGAGYAAWQENVVISGQVSTGDLKPIFILGTASDTDGGSYSSISSSLETPQKMIVTVTNGFPDVNYKINNFAVKNDGTMPMKLYSLNINSAAYPDKVSMIITDGDGASIEHYPLSLDPGQVAYFDLSLCVMDAAAQAGNYEFEITATAMSYHP
jgi:hypothetical protein